MSTTEILNRLHDLVTDIDCPFRFVPLGVAGDKLAGARIWLDGTRDTMEINSETDARVTRHTPAGDLVFDYTDTLARVIDAVADRLPNPSDPRAPRLVLPRVVGGYTPG